MPYTLSRDAVGCDGGHDVTITGTFPVNEPIEVFLGPHGNHFDAPCFGGAGYGYNPVSANGLTVTITTPPMATGTQKVTVRISRTNYAADDLKVVERVWRHKSYAIRSEFPPWSAVGARRLALEKLECPAAPTLPADEEEMSRLPRLTWTGATTIGVTAPPGNVDSPLQYRLQDAVTRTISSSGGVWDPSLGVAEWGLDTGAEAVSTFYYLYLVEKSGSPPELVVKGSVNPPPTGPTGHSEFLYIGSVFNDSAGDLEEFSHVGNHFLKIVAGGLTLNTSHTTWDSSSFGTNVQTMNLETDRTGGWVPKTAGGAFINVYLQVGSGSWGSHYVGQYGDLSPGYLMRAVGGASSQGEGSALIVPLVDSTKRFDYERVQGAGTLNNSALRILGWIDEYLPG
jgi:hypothetical protein